MDQKLDEMEQWMAIIMMVWAFEAFTEMVSKLVQADRETLAAAVGHEPTWQNFQDYWAFQRLKNAGQIVLQREADREKLRRLVFGEDGAAGAPK